jgi:micrococcal nuclease
MPRILTLLLALTISLSAAAEEQRKTAQPESDSRETAARKAAAAAETDSPLVAAAKRTGRLGKTPDILITHETLKETAGKGRITTTTVQRDLPPEPEKVEPSISPAEWAAAQKKAEDEKKAAAARAAAREREKKRLLAAAAEAAEDGYLDDFAEDPAAAEQRLRELEIESPPPNR